MTATFEEGTEYLAEFPMTAMAYGTRIVNMGTCTAKARCIRRTWCYVTFEITTDSGTTVQARGRIQDQKVDIRSDDIVEHTVLRPKGCKEISVWANQLF